MALPSVKDWTKNVLKSTAYATNDIVKGLAPGYAEFTETNKELFTDAFVAVKDYRRTFKRISDAFGKSRVYEAAEAGFKNAMDDLKTGKLYNKEREAKYNEKAAEAMMGDMGGDFDMSSFDSGSSSGDGFDADAELDKILGDSGDSGMDITSGDELIASTVSGSSKAAADQISEVTLKAAKVNMTAQKISTNILYAQNEKMMNISEKGFTGVTDAINNIEKILTEPFKTHIDNSTKYYEETTKIHKENNAILKEMLEMQRNQYKAQQEEEKKKKEEINYNSITGSSGMPDLKEYGKNIAKNFKDILSEKGMESMYGMMFGSNDGIGAALGENPIMAFVQNPLGGMMTMLGSAMLGTNLKVATKNLDKTMSNLFSAMMGKFEGMTKDEEGGAINQFIGKLLGVKNTMKTSLETGAYHKGSMPWDGESKKALTEVIPTLLASIDAGINGTEMKLYDYKSGKFTTMQAVRKQFERNKKEAIRGASSDINSLILEVMKDQQYANIRDKEEFADTLRRLNEIAFENGGVYQKLSQHKKNEDLEELLSDLGINNRSGKIIARILREVDGKNTRKSDLMGFFGNKATKREQYTNSLKAMEEDSTNINRALFNNSINMEKYDEKTGMYIRNRYDQKSGRGGLFGLDITNAMDKHGNTVFYYLENMYKELQFIRQYGSGRGPGFNLDFKNGKLIFKRGKPIGRIEDMNVDESNKDKAKTNKDYYNDNRTREEQRIREKYEKAKEKWEAGEDKKGKYSDFLEFMKAGQADEDTTHEWNLMIIDKMEEIERKRKEAEKEENTDAITNFLDENRKDRNEKFKDTIDKMQKKGMVDTLLEASSLGEKWAVIQEGLEGLVAKPAGVLTKVLEEADERIYQFFYKEQPMKLKDGTEVTGFFGRMQAELEQTFDKVNNWLTDEILSPLKEKLGITGPMDAIKKGLGYFGIDAEGMWNSAKESMSNFFTPIKEKTGEMFDNFFADAKDYLREQAEAAKRMAKGQTKEEYEQEKVTNNQKKDEKSYEELAKLRDDQEEEERLSDEYDELRSSYYDDETGKVILENMSEYDRNRMKKIRDIMKGRGSLQTRIDMAKDNLQEFMAGKSLIDDSKRNKLKKDIVELTNKLNELVKQYDEDEYDETGNKVYRRSIQDKIDKIRKKLIDAKEDYNNSYTKSEYNQLNQFIQQLEHEKYLKDKKLENINGEHNSEINRNDRMNDFITKATKGGTIDLKEMTDNDQINIQNMLKGSSSKKVIDNLFELQKPQFMNFINQFEIKDERLKKLFLNKIKEKVSKDSMILLNPSKMNNIKFFSDILDDVSKDIGKEVGEYSFGEATLGSNINHINELKRSGSYDNKKLDRVVSDINVNNELQRVKNNLSVYTDDSKLNDLQLKQEEPEEIEISFDQSTDKVTSSITELKDKLLQKLDDVISAFKLSTADNKAEGGVVDTLNNLEQGELAVVSEGETINGIKQPKGKVLKGGFIALGNDTEVIANKDKAERERNKISEANLQYKTIERIQNASKYAEGKDNKDSNKKDDEKKTVAEYGADMAKGLADGFKDIAGTFGDSLNKAFGFDSEKTLDDIKKATKDTSKTLQDYLPNTIFKSVLGGAAGMFVGGPLVGALLGGAVAITEKNGYLQSLLFGEAIKNDKGETIGHKDGIISKDLQDTFKKYAKDFGGMGAIGAGLGLITPFGPLGGAILGAGASIVKNNETLSKFVFGESIDEDSGLLSKKTRDKVTKYLPKMGAGAVSGAVLGTILGGPFGLMGNMVLGAGGSLIATSDTFQDFMFGKKDSAGIRDGGITGALKRQFVDPLVDTAKEVKDGTIDFFSKKIFKPLSSAFFPITKQMELGVKWIFKKGMFTKVLGWAFDNTFGRLFKGITKPLYATIEKWVMNPIKKVGQGLYNKFMKPLANIGKKIISAPFAAIGMLGNRFKKSQVKSGNADYMTAQDRMNMLADDYQKAREKGFEGDISDYAKKAGYKYYQTDNMLMNMNRQDLEQLKANAKVVKGGNKQLEKDLKKQEELLWSDTNSVFNKGGWTELGSETRDTVATLMKEGKFDEAIKEINSYKELGTEDKKKGIKVIKEAAERYHAAKAAKEKFKGDSDAARASIAKSLGIDVKKLDDRELDKILGLTNQELKTKELRVEDIASGKVSEKSELTGNYANTTLLATTMQDSAKEQIDAMKECFKELEKTIMISSKSAVKYSDEGGWQIDADQKTGIEEIGNAVNNVDKNFGEKGELTIEGTSGVNKYEAEKMLSKYGYIKANLKGKDFINDNILETLTGTKAGQARLAQIETILERNQGKKNNYRMDKLSTMSEKDFGRFSQLDELGRTGIDLDAIRSVDDKGNSVMTDDEWNNILYQAKIGLGMNDGETIENYKYIEPDVADIIKLVRDMGTNSKTLSNETIADMYYKFGKNKNLVISYLQGQTINNKKGNFINKLEGRAEETKAEPKKKGLFDRIKGFFGRNNSIPQIQGAAEGKKPGEKGGIFTVSTGETIVEDTKKKATLTRSDKDDNKTESTQYGDITLKQTTDGKMVAADTSSKKVMDKVEEDHENMANTADNTTKLVDIAEEYLGIEKKKGKKEEKKNSIFDLLTKGFKFFKDIFGKILTKIPVIGPIVSAIGGLASKIADSIKNALGLGKGVNTPNTPKPGTPKPEEGAKVEDAAAKAAREGAEVEEAAAKKYKGFKGVIESIKDDAVLKADEVGTKVSEAAAAAKAGVVGSKLYKAGAFARNLFKAGATSPIDLAKDLHSLSKEGSITNFVENFNKNELSKATEASEWAHYLANDVEVMTKGDRLTIAKGKVQSVAMDAGDEIMKFVSKGINKCASVAANLVGALGVEPGKFTTGMQKLGEALAKTVEQKGAGKLLAKVGAKAIPFLGEALIVVDASEAFYDGLDNPNAVLGIQGEVSTGDRLIAAIANCLTNLCTLGIVDGSTVVGLVADYIGPLLGMDELKKKREEAEKARQAYNEENGTGLDMEEYLKASETGSASFIDSIKNGISNNAEYVWNGIKNNAEYVKNGIANNGEYVWNGIKNNAEYVKNRIANNYEDVWNGIKNNAEYVKNRIANNGEYVWNGIKNNAEYVKNGITNNAEYVANGIKSGVQGVKDFVSSKVADLSSLGSYASNLISTEIDHWDWDANNGVGDAYKIADNDPLYAPKAAIGSIVSTIAPVIAIPINTVKKLNEWINEKVMTPISKEIDEIKTGINDMIVPIENGLSIIGDNLSQMPNKYNDYIDNGDVSGIWSTKGIAVGKGYGTIPTLILQTAEALYGLASTPMAIYNAAGIGIRDNIIKPVSDGMSNIETGVNQLSGKYNNYIDNGDISGIWSDESTVVNESYGTIPSFIIQMAEIMNKVVSTPMAVYNAAGIGIRDNIIKPVSDGMSNIETGVNQLSGKYNNYIDNGDISGIWSDESTAANESYGTIPSFIIQMAEIMNKVVSTPIAGINAAGIGIRDNIIKPVSEGLSNIGTAVSAIPDVFGPLAKVGDFDSIITTEPNDNSDGFSHVINVGIYGISKALYGIAAIPFGIATGIGSITDQISNEFNSQADAVESAKSQIDPLVKEGKPWDILTIESSIDTSTIGGKLSRFGFAITKLFNAVAAFPKYLAKTIDDMTGGVISSTIDWFKNKFSESKSAANQNKGGKGSGKIKSLYGRGEVDDYSDIPEYNRPKDDDLSPVREAKLAAIAKQRAAKTDNVSQLDPAIKNQPFNIPGDTEKQTVGDSACGEMAAASAIKQAAGNSTIKPVDDYSDIPEYNRPKPEDDLTVTKAKLAAIAKQRAARNVEINPQSFIDKGLKYKEKDGGTKYDYFNDQAKDFGMKATRVTGKDEIKKNAERGIPQVVDGIDNRDGMRTPFGPNNHYVTISGIKGNTAIVQDPEQLSSNTPYKANEVLGKANVAYKFENNNLNDIPDYNRPKPEDDLTVIKAKMEAINKSRDKKAKEEKSILINSGVLGINDKPTTTITQNMMDRQTNKLSWNDGQKLIDKVNNNLMNNTSQRMIMKRRYEQVLNNVKKSRSKYGKGKYGRGKNAVEYLWDYFTKNGYSEVAAAGILGNWKRESGVNPHNLEASWLVDQSRVDRAFSSPEEMDKYCEEIIFPNTPSANPEEYKGDDGHYHPGMGLAQWTAERGQKLADKAKSMNKSQGDIDPQMALFNEEMNGGYSKVKEEINSASNPQDAAMSFFHDFEGIDDGTGPERTDWAQKIFDAKGKGIEAADIDGSISGNTGSSSSSSSNSNNSSNSNSGGLIDQFLNGLPGISGLVSTYSKLFGGGNSSSSGGSSNNKSGSSYNGASVGGDIEAAAQYAESRVGTEGYGNDGCTEWAMDFLEHAKSPFPDQMRADGMNPFWTPDLMTYAQKKNLWKTREQGGSVGDLALIETNGDFGDGPDHTVVADGKGGCWGNSSSKNQIRHYPSMADAWNGEENIYGYVATGSGGSTASKSTGSGGRSEAEIRAEAGSTSGGGSGKDKSIMDDKMDFLSEKDNMLDKILSDNSSKYGMGSGKNKYGRGEDLTNYYNTLNQMKDMDFSLIAKEDFPSKKDSKETLDAKLNKIKSYIGTKKKNDNDYAAINRGNRIKNAYMAQLKEYRHQEWENNRQKELNYIRESAKYEKNDIDYLLSKGYSKEDALETLKNNSKYSEENVKARKMQAKIAKYEENDWNHLKQAGYSDEDAIAALDATDKYRSKNSYADKANDWFNSHSKGKNKSSAGSTPATFTSTTPSSETKKKDDKKETKYYDKNGKEVKITSSTDNKSNTTTNTSNNKTNTAANNSTNAIEQMMNDLQKQLQSSMQSMNQNMESILKPSTTNTTTVATTNANDMIAKANADNAKKDNQSNVSQKVESNNSVSIDKLSSNDSNNQSMSNLQETNNILLQMVKLLTAIVSNTTGLNLNTNNNEPKQPTDQDKANANKAKQVKNQFRDLMPLLNGMNFNVPGNSGSNMGLAAVNQNILSIVSR